MNEFKFTLKVAFRYYKSELIFLSILGLFDALITLVIYGTLIPLTIRLIGFDSYQNQGVYNVLEIFGVSTLYDANPYLFLSIIFSASIFFTCLKSYYIALIGASLNKDIKFNLLRSLSLLDWKSFLYLNNSRYYQCLISESSLARGALSDLASALTYLVVASVLLLYLAIYSTVTFVSTFSILIIYIWINKYIVKMLNIISKTRINVVTKLSLDTNIWQNNFKTFLAENLLVYKKQETEHIIDNIFLVEKKQALYSAISDSFSQSFVFIALITLSLAQTMFGDGINSSFLLDLVVIQKITSAITNFQSKRSSAAIKIPSYYACSDLFHNKFHQNFQIEQLSPLTPLPAPQFPTSINVKSGSFTAANKKQILNNIDLNITMGSINFIIGPSGSGKTTLLDLLAGLNKFDSELSLKLFNQNTLITTAHFTDLAYVKQDNTLFSLTLRDFLTYGADDHNDSSIWHILSSVFLLDKIKSLDDGLNTKITESARLFSGGEIQRLSIARALLKGSKVVFLDEPTSALDPLTEKNIFQNLQQFAKDKIFIIVTHSVDAIPEGSRIINLDVQ